MALHSAVGCVASAAQGGSCGAGAVSGAVQAIYAGADLGGSRGGDKQQLLTAELLGAFTGYVFSGGDAQNVALGAQIACSGYENNYLKHTDIALAKQKLAQCGEDSACQEGVIEDLRKASNANDAALAETCAGATSSQCAIDFLNTPDNAPATVVSSAFLGNSTVADNIRSENLLHFGPDALGVMGLPATSYEIIKGASAAGQPQKVIFELSRSESYLQELEAIKSLALEGGDVLATGAATSDCIARGGSKIGCSFAAIKTVSSLSEISPTPLPTGKELGKVSSKAQTNTGVAPNDDIVKVDIGNAKKGTPEYDALNNPKPNTTTELSNGTTFKTGEGGFVKEVIYQPVDSSRVRDSRQTAVGKEGIAGDVGGHIQACRHGGTCDRFNLFPQNSNFNNSAYKKWENEITRSLQNGDNVGNVKVNLDRADPYNPRPDSVTIEYEINGVKKRKEFENQAGG